MVFRSLVLFLFFTSILFSQIKIDGKVLDENKSPLSGANVTITKIKGGAILAYAISDTYGVYSLSINSKLDSLQVNSSYIGYTKQTKSILNKNQRIDFFLTESFENLKEVIIKSNPITKNGDTLNYSVSLFKSQKDRVISDVLKKLPGIEILNDGKILYQGKPIQKYYIEGLDLLEGKYNLANNNLPANSVSKIQVIENHQPIKMLDSLVFSDRASLNIKLKKDIIVTGTSKLGVGLTPLLWNANITPMFFKKKQQMIASYQTNNIGNDILNQTKTLTTEELLDEYDDDKINWVTINKLPNPSFSEGRWLNNNAHLLTTNYLLRLKKDLDIKINLSYNNDYQKKEGSSQTTFFTVTDTTAIIENTKNKTYLNSLKNKLTLTNNTTKNYFKNTFEINKYWNSQTGESDFNNKKLQQKAKTPFISFNNKLKLLKPLKKNIITIKSILNYTNSLQTLSFNQSRFEDLLNYNAPIEQIKQRVNHSNFHTDNSFSITKGIKNFTLIPAIGFNIQNQKLNSKITLFTNNTEDILTDEFQNNLVFNKVFFYTYFNIQYHNNNWKVKLNLPFKTNIFKRYDNYLNRKQQLNKTTFEPSLSITKNINSYWKTTISTSLTNDFGNINQLHYGYIINNYRSIKKYEIPILESFRKNFSFNFLYRNPIKSLFINGFYSHRSSTQNLLFENTINSNGATYFSFSKKNNNNNTHNINLRGSKYFSKLNTTLTVITNASFNNKKQLLNNTVINATSKNIQLKGKLNTEITEWLDVEYKNGIAFSNACFEGQKKIINIKSQEHLLNLNFYPSSNQYISFNTEYSSNYFYNQTQENYFLNLNYRYSFEKSKIDLELNWNNILNSKESTIALNNAFSYTLSSYILKPRQILANIKFNF